MFDINITVLIQFVNFAVTLAVLDFLLIRPIRGIIKKRRDLASAMINDAESFTDDAAKKLEAYEASLAKAREEAAALREERKSEAVAKEADIVRQAQKEAQDYIQTSRENTRKAVAEAMADMKKRTPDLAKLAAKRLLGKKAA